MANDRVFIKCKYCGGWKMLLKFYPTSGSTYRDNGILEWLDDHAGCHPSFRCGLDLGGDAGFTLHTEGADELKPEKQNYVPEILKKNIR